MKDEGALVLLSGGQDSATCLAWALDRYTTVDTIGFNYHQKHAIELQMRDELRSRMAAMKPEWAAAMGVDHTLKIDTFELANSSLTGVGRERADGLPNTFVPGRNLLFFVYAGIIAERRGLTHLVGGMCETDYSGYPDCRNETLRHLDSAIRLGLGTHMTIDTPLMFIDKCATWWIAANLGGEPLVDLILEHSHTCYAGNRKDRHAWGYGCDTCAACELRKNGWSKFCRELAS